MPDADGFERTVSSEQRTHTATALLASVAPVEGSHPPARGGLPLQRGLRLNHHPSSSCGGVGQCP